jgi:hypothetical protein
MAIHDDAPLVLATIGSTTYLRISTAHAGAAATATDSGWLVMTSAIRFPP